MLFTELNTDVLLHIYGCLDPIDSINLAETCTRLRDVAQQHYKRFKIFNLKHFILNEMDEPKRHNRIDATTVLKHIGPFIQVLVTDLDVDEIGSDVSISIGKYCVNLKSLEISDWRSEQPVQNQYTAYFDWLRKVNLTKITLPIRDLFLIDLSDITTLDELHIYYNPSYIWVEFGRIADILERNVNISCLRIPLIDDFKYETLGKLKCLKRLVLDIEYDESKRQLEKVAANLKMMALEKVEIIYDTERRVDGLNEFLQKLSENALQLKHLSITVDPDYDMLDTYPLSSLHLLNLTSLRWIDIHPNLYKEIPKMQPNLTHLDLIIYEGSDLASYIGGTLPKPMEKINFLIKNLEKLELLHVQFLWRSNISSTLKDFLKESVLCRIFDCHSINRPTVTLRLLECQLPYCCFLQVELDLRARKWKWALREKSDCKGFVEHQTLLPFYDWDAETVDNLLTVQRFSGSASDLNAVKDEANKWIHMALSVM